MMKLTISTGMTLIAGIITFSGFSLTGTRGLLLTISLIILGFILLIKGGDHLVTGGSSIASLYDIPPIVIGLTILAFGTSAPELFVNLIAALRGETDLLLANVIGSNMSNLLLIGGVASIIFTLKVKDNTLYAEIPFSLFAILLLFVLVNDTVLDGLPFNILSHSDGIVLLMVFLIFLYYIFSLIKSGIPGQLDEREHHDLRKSLWMLLLGIIGLYIGGELIVSNAVTIAETFGVSKLLIGSTILAIGTSIPELVTSVIAAFKKQADMAVGNIIGSNVFNIFWIAGLSSLIKPIPVDSALNIDIFMLITATLFFFTGIYSHKEKSLTRFHGVIFLCLYAGYLGFLFWRG